MSIQCVSEFGYYFFFLPWSMANFIDYLYIDFLLFFSYIWYIFLIHIFLFLLHYLDYFRYCWQILYYLSNCLNRWNIIRFSYFRVSILKIFRFSLSIFISSWQRPPDYWPPGRWSCCWLRSWPKFCRPGLSWYLFPPDSSHFLPENRNLIYHSAAYLLSCESFRCVQNIIFFTFLTDFLIYWCEV